MKKKEKVETISRFLENVYNIFKKEIEQLKILTEINNNIKNKKKFETKVYNDDNRKDDSDENSNGRNENEEIREKGSEKKRKSEEKTKDAEKINNVNPSENTKQESKQIIEEMKKEKEYEMKKEKEYEKDIEIAENRDEDIEKEKVKNKDKNDIFILLCNDVGIELFSEKDIEKYKENLKHNARILFQKTYFLISLNTKNQPHILIILKTSVENLRNSLKNIYYYLYHYCETTFENKVYRYFEVNNCFLYFKEKHIHVIDFSKEIWNNQSFSKKEIKQKMENAGTYDSICFILSYNVLLKEYKMYVRKIIQNIKKEKRRAIEKEKEKGKEEPLIFFLSRKKMELSFRKKKQDEQKTKRKKPTKIEKTYGGKEETEEIEKREEKEEEEDEEKEPNDLIIHSLPNKYMSYNHEPNNEPFFEKIKDIFCLLNNKNVSLLEMYSIEKYTRIFVYNCEKLNRFFFFHFLKNYMEDWYIYTVNINTLFGLYFSETEKNISNIFNKCKTVMQKKKKNVCLVIDGIDIISKKKYMETEQQFHYADQDKNRKHKKEQIHNSYKNNNESNNYNTDTNSISCGIGNDTNCNNDSNSNTNRMVVATLLLCLDGIDNDTSWKGKNAQIKKKKEKEKNNIRKQIKEGIDKKEERKKELDEMDEFCSFSDTNNIGRDDNIISSDELSSNSKSFSYLIHKTKEKERNQKKLLQKMTEKITYNKKELKRFYKKKCAELFQKKTEMNLSVIVLSDLSLNSFDVSFIRAGRFFHYIKYS